MAQQNKRNKIILGLVGAIGGSMLIGLPALAQVTNPRSPEVYSDKTSPLDPNSPLYQRSSDRSVQDNSVSQQAQNRDSQRYNGNGEVNQPNNPNISPDSNNPGLNLNPANRLTPTNPGSDSSGAGNSSSDSGMNRGMMGSDPNQQQINGGYISPNNSTRSSFSQTSSSVLNPCPSIFYEPKYRDTVGIPAGCPASYPGTSSTPSVGQ
jgi:hypothetical protein